MVGECLAEHNEVAPHYAGLPAMFEFSFWYRLMWALSNKTGMYFAKDILSYQSEYATHNSNYIEATKLSNHDEDRTAYVLSGNLNWCKQAGAVLLTAQGHPYIYYGEELAMNPKTTKEGNGDEYNRGPLPWGDSYTTQPNKVFNKSVNANTDNVTTQVSNSSSILNVYRTFTKLRNTYPALATGKMTKHGTYNESNSSFPTIAAWYMTEGSQKILVVHNLGSSTVEVPITDNINKVIGILNSVEQNGNKYRMSANSSIVFLLN
jgi:glycosidase